MAGTAVVVVGGRARRRKPTFVGWSQEKEECAGRVTGEPRRLPGSHVSGAPVRLAAKCKVASRQF